MRADSVNLPEELSSVVVDGRYLGDRYPGIARYVFNLVRAIAELAPSLSMTLLVDPREPQTRFDVGDLTARGVALEPMKRPLRSLHGYFAGRRVGRDRASAVFHAPHIFSALSIVPPSVVSIHDLLPTHAAARLRRRRDRAVYRVMLRRALASAGGVLTPSPVVAEELERVWGVPAERIAVTPYAADPRFAALPSAAADTVGSTPLAAARHLSAQSPVPEREAEDERPRALERHVERVPERYLLYVGTGRPHKNLPRLVRAWSMLDRQSRRGCSLVIAGPLAPGELGPERVAAAPESGIVLLGAVNEADLAGLYRGARMLVHPALGEGFGLTVIEAMASGVPVACSTSASLDAVCGEAAVRFDPCDVAAIAGAVEKLLRDEGLRDRLIRAGAARAAELTWSRTAELTLGAYARVARQPAVGSA